MAIWQKKKRSQNAFCERFSSTAGEGIFCCEFSIQRPRFRWDAAQRLTIFTPASNSSQLANERAIRIPHSLTFVRGEAKPSGK
jgi:hypothetical protein